MKKATRIAAFFAAFGMLLSAALPQTVSADTLDPAEEHHATGELEPEKVPDWVPQDFDAALEFLNTYGATHIQEGYLCTVFRETPNSADITAPLYNVELEGTALKQIYGNHFINPEEEYGQNTIEFEVCVFRAAAPGESRVTLHDQLAELLQLAETRHANDRKMKIVPAARYTFAVDNDLKLKETDIYEWMPDSASEYKAFVEANGKVSTHGEYMLFCLSASAGTPYQWKQKTDENGGCISPEMSVDCSPVTAIPLDGGMVNTIKLYRTYWNDQVDIVWNLVSLTDDSILETLESTFDVIDPDSTVLMPGDTLIEIYDADTKELLDFNEINTIDSETPKATLSAEVRYYNPEQFGGDGWISSEPIYILEKNATILKDIAKHFGADVFNLHLNINDANFKPVVDSMHISKMSNDAYRVRFYVKRYTTGDMNGDDSLSIADAVAMQKMITGDSSAMSANWKRADFNSDNRLDARDLTMMLRELCYQRADKKVKLQLKATFGGYGVTGQPLGSGYVTREFVAFAGDTFYENNSSEWEKSRLGFLSADPIITIKEITSEGVVIDVAKKAGSETGKITLKYGEKIELHSMIPIMDGINYTYEVSFINPHRYFENDHTNAC